MDLEKYYIGKTYYIPWEEFIEFIEEKVYSQPAYIESGNKCFLPTLVGYRTGCYTELFLRLISTALGVNVTQSYVTGGGVNLVIEE